MSTSFYKSDSFILFLSSFSLLTHSQVFLALCDAVVYQLPENWLGEKVKFQSRIYSRILPP